jgi:outer membrane immunogenic protein
LILSQWEIVMLRTVAMIGATLMLGSVSALAADLSLKAPPAYQPAFNWTGYYLGVGGGAEFATATGSGAAGFNVQDTLWFVSVDGGYRLQLPDNLVLGFDVFAPVWVSKGNFTPTGFGGGIDSAKVDFAVVPEVQLGYAIGRFLPYVGIGVGVADVSAQSAAVPGQTDTELTSLMTATFGFDYALTNNWTLGARYDHIVAAERSYSFTPAGGFPIVSQVGADLDGVSGVLRYKF